MSLCTGFASLPFIRLDVTPSNFNCKKQHLYTVNPSFIHNCDELDELLGHNYENLQWANGEMVLNI